MDTESFKQQMEEQGLGSGSSIDEIMAQLPGVFYAGKGGYAIQHKDTFIPLPSESQVRQHLAMAGVPKELMTAVICRIRTDNYVSYIGPVAGHSPGAYHSPDSGQKFLVTCGPTIIKGKPGEMPFIRRFLSQFFGAALQIEAILGWWRQARRNVIDGERRPLPICTLIGPPNGGKTLFLNITREILGGRAASAFQFLAGKTEFNGDIIGAELTLIDDEIAHHEYRARTAFAQAIKRDHFASSVRLRKMYHEAIVLRPVQSLAIAVNNEAEHLQVLPTMDNSMRDKLSLFWCGKADLDGMRDRREIWERIKGELPALCYYLDTTEHPEELMHPRTGCAAWQSMEALEALQAISPEERLVELISQCSSVRASIEDGSSGWRGTSAELEYQLGDDPVTRRGAEKLFRWDSACGSILGKLERSRRIDISSRFNRGNRTWLIKSLQPVEGQTEAADEAYSVRGWSGGPNSSLSKQEKEKNNETETKPVSESTTPPCDTDCNVLTPNMFYPDSGIDAAVEGFGATLIDEGKNQH